MALWKDAYCTDGDDHSDRNKGEKGIEVASGIGNPATTKGEENHTVFAMETTKSLVTALRHVQPVGRDQVERIWTWLRGEMDQLNGF